MSAALVRNQCAAYYQRIQVRIGRYILPKPGTENDLRIRITSVKGTAPISDPVKLDTEIEIDPVMPGEAGGTMGFGAVREMNPAPSA